jgi:hypothetical protein
VAERHPWRGRHRSVPRSEVSAGRRLWTASRHIAHICERAWPEAVRAWPTVGALFSPLRCNAARVVSRRNCRDRRTPESRRLSTLVHKFGNVFCYATAASADAWNSSFCVSRASHAINLDKDAITALLSVWCGRPNAADLGKTGLAFLSNSRSTALEEASLRIRCTTVYVARWRHDKKGEFRRDATCASSES